MLKWHLIGNQGNRGENYLGFVNAGVKYRSFANAYGHCEKMQHYVLCLRHICEQNPPVAGVYEKANTGSEAGVKLLFPPQKCYRKRDLKEATTSPSTAEGWKTHRLAQPG